MTTRKPFLEKKTFDEPVKGAVVQKDEWLKNYLKSDDNDFELMVQGVPENIDLDNAKIVMPYWNNETFSVPNALLRSAIFAAFREETRSEIVKITHSDNAVITKKKIESVEYGIQMERFALKYHGLQLDQYDLDVWQAIMRICMDEGHWDIEFSLRSLLKLIGHNSLKSDHYVNVRDSLDRLSKGIVTITMQSKNDEINYTGCLVSGVTNDSQGYHVSINPKIAKLFVNGAFTRINHEQRLSLGNAPLAKWIHAFYSSHTNPHPYSLSKLFDLCGSKDESKRSFKQRFTEASERISKVTGWTISVSEKNIVTVDKSTEFIPAQKQITAD